MTHASLPAPRCATGVLLSCALLALTMAAAPAAQAPAPAAAAPRALVVNGEVKTPLLLTPAEFKSLPRARAEIKEDGRTVVYEGVLVGELLGRAGASVGGELRGNAVASYVVATASDGYQAIFSLAELDPAFTSSEIIVADTVDGKPLFDYQGPFRIVAPKDSRAARSVRMLERLEVVRLQKGK